MPGVPVTSSETTPDSFVPWARRAAFPFVSLSFYVSQFCLGVAIYHGNWWLVVPLSLWVSHLMHGMLVGFHEASHGMLRKNRIFNNSEGILIGVLSFTSFTLYRVLHQAHHMHLATEKDVELWPFVETDSPRWKRRLAAFLELNFGLFFTPFLFWRGFFHKDSAIRNRRVRKQIWKEFFLAIGFWIVTITLVARFDLWPYFWWNYFVPGFIAGNLQSWRKYIEHVGLSGNEARSATRSIVANTWMGRVLSWTLLHEPLHGIHHLKSSLPHSELPDHTEWLDPAERGDTTPFPNYRSAFLDLMGKLRDPRVGSQWQKVEAREG